MHGSYTVTQANRTLPLVGRIVEDIVRHYARWQEMVARCETILAQNSEQAREQAEALQVEIQRTASEIDRFLAELGELGVQFKAFDVGLVDFPGKLEGRDIFLCWRLGESAVDHWHEVDDGFAGRKPVSGEPGLDS